MLAAKKAGQGMGKKKTTNADLCFQLDGERSVKTIHGANDGRRASGSTPQTTRFAGTASAADSVNARTPAPSNGAREDDDSSEDEESWMTSSHSSEGSASHDEESVASG